MNSNSFLGRHVFLKRGVTGLLYLLAFAAASAYWLLPLPYFLLAALALSLIYALATWAGVELRTGRSVSSK